MAAPEPRSFRESALKVALAWLAIATVHRLLVLGRYHVSVIGIFGQDPVGLEARHLPLALANGIATDLCSFTLFVVPALVVAHFAQRGPRAVRLASFALPWVAAGFLSIGLVFNLIAFRHTGRALDFLLLTSFTRGSDLQKFVLLMAGGAIRLLVVLVLAGSVPYAVAAVTSRLVKRRLPSLSWRLVALLVLVQLVYAVTAPARGARIPSHRGRIAFTLIREYEDPIWRLGTGALWAWQSPTARREISQREFEILRPVLTPGDDTPASDPRYPLFRTLEDSRERIVDVAAPEEPPNIVLVLLEGNGTADIGAFGDAGGLTPCFDALASEGLLYENYYTNASDSVGSFYSILWSGYPDIDGSRDNIRPVRGSLPEILSRQGYSTLIVADDWNKLSDLSRGVGFEPIEVGKTSWGDDRQVFARALERTAASTKPYFLTVFTMTHHSPWVLPDGSGKAGQSEWERSREALAYQDRALCDFVREIRARDTTTRRTLLILAGDHGSHIPVGGFTELFGLPEHAIHVPLLLHAPGWIPASRSPVLGSHVDVLPTVIDLVGIRDAESAAVGRSLLRGGQSRVFASNSTGAGFLALLRGDRKLVHDIYRGGTSLSHLGTDDPASTDEAIVEGMLNESFLVNRFAAWLLMREAVAPPHKERE